MSPINELLTEERFCDWVAQAAAGDSVIYHEGLLSRDRARSITGYSLSRRARLDKLADRVQKACETGLVNLMSQRLDEYVYRYFAIKANVTAPKTPKPPTEPLGPNEIKKVGEL